MLSGLCTGLDFGGGQGKLEKDVLRAEARAMVLRGGATGLQGGSSGLKEKPGGSLRASQVEA